MKNRTVSQEVFNNHGKTQSFKLAFIAAEKELEEKHETGVFAEGDPNHPMYSNGYNYATGKYVNLFGYNQDEFMAKQYK